MSPASGRENRNARFSQSRRCYDAGTGVRSIADLLYFVPGATPGTGESNRDQITLRGNSTTADFFVNGLRDDVQYFRDLYNVDRIEVLKGPNAMIFGRGGGGGIVNRVQKAPLSEPLTAGSASLNSEGGFDIAADINLPIGMGMDAALRVNGFYEQIESHRDFVSGERYAVNPYVALDTLEERMRIVKPSLIAFDAARNNSSMAVSMPAAPLPRS